MRLVSNGSVLQIGESADRGVLTCPICPVWGGADRRPGALQIIHNFVNWQNEYTIVAVFKLRREFRFTLEALPWITLLAYS